MNDEASPIVKISGIYGLKTRDRLITKKMYNICILFVSWSVQSTIHFNIMSL